MHLFFATDNKCALILRRAKDRMYNLIAWNRADDSFVEGQWIREDVWPDLCSLSPDGQHFLYHVKNSSMWRQATENYTVVSRPPWFTAVALFPQGGLSCAGGSFVSNNQFVIDGDLRTDDIIGRATGLTQLIRGDATPNCPTGLRLRNGNPAQLAKRVRERLLSKEPVHAPSPLDHYEAQGGRLYRRIGMELHLIRDFTDMEPRFVPAPYDDRDFEKKSRGWHPSDSRARP